MADRFDVKLTGFAELHNALGEFPKAMERAVLRRVAVKALTPIAESAKAKAPVSAGTLRDSIVVGTKLTRKAKAAAKADPKKGVRVFVGTSNEEAVPREFGSVRSAPQPFLRPAWDEGSAKLLTDTTRLLGEEIERTRARVAKKAAKAKG